MNTEENLSATELRQFGFTTAAIVIGLFGLVLPWLFDKPLPVWPWLIAALLALPALIYPSALRPVHKAWLKFGHVLGWINTRLILGILFFLVVTPISAVMRLFRHDPMRKRRDTENASYRIRSSQRNRDHFERPF